MVFEMTMMGGGKSIAAANSAPLLSAMQCGDHMLPCTAAITIAKIDLTKQRQIDA